MNQNENSKDFHELMREVRSGSSAAARELHQMYESHVLRYVRRRMPEQIRSKFDSIDFTQAVWATFFGNIDQAGEFKTPEAFVAWLGAVAQNKVIDETRRRLVYQKANVNREQAIGNDSLREPPQQAVTPSQEAIANEQWSRITRTVPESHRQMLALKAQGNSNEEIARVLGCNERTVRRVIRKLESKLD